MLIREGKTEIEMGQFENGGDKMDLSRTVPVVTTIQVVSSESGLKSTIELSFNVSTSEGEVPLSKKVTEGPINIIIFIITGYV